MPHVLATSAGEPDSEFRSLSAMAKFILAKRDERARGYDVRIGPAVVGRDAIPNGVAIAVRFLDGSNRGHGQLLGYAFCEAPAVDESRPQAAPDLQGRLMTAIAAAAAEAAEQGRPVGRAA